MDLCFRSAGHPAISMWHHQNARNVEQMGGEDKSAQYVVGDPGSSVSNDFGISRLHSHDGQRSNSRIDASDDGKTASRLTGERT